ncbi:hypothetical protein KLP28_11910 [Nocardioidaceae bacterium]|nr:hypothetical protein KLP28_11910 [Nocardioidaceae bacterium]
MSQWLEQLSTLQVLLLVVAVVFGGSIIATVVGALLVRRGRRSPKVLRLWSKIAEKAFLAVRRPLTIVVLDEVTAVIQTGHYTQNISDALIENYDEIKGLVAEKVAEDRNTKLVQRLPGYDAIVSEATEMVLRVTIQMLADPRTDELVRDALRNNVQQIRQAVREREHEAIDEHEPPDPAGTGAPIPESSRYAR